MDRDWRQRHGVDLDLPREWLNLCRYGLAGHSRAKGTASSGRREAGKPRLREGVGSRPPPRVSSRSNSVSLSVAVLAMPRRPARSVEMVDVVAALQIGAIACVHEDEVVHGAGTGAVHSLRPQKGCRRQHDVGRARGRRQEVILRHRNSTPSSARPRSVTLGHG